MTCITIKTKETKANVQIFPPIALNGRSHISLIDIKIPEEVIKNFTFTTRQVITTGPNEKVPKMIPFPKGVYNIYKLQDMIYSSPLAQSLILVIGSNNHNVFIKTKSETIKISAELAQILNIPETLPPFSAIKISSNEYYLINCNLVENRSSYAFGPKIRPSSLLAVAPSRDGSYPELSIQSGNKIMNNLILEIITETFESPDFGEKEIMYILKVW